MRRGVRRFAWLLVAVLAAWGVHELLRVRNPTPDDEAWEDAEEVGRDADGPLGIPGSASGQRLSGRRRARPETLLEEIWVWAKDLLGISSDEDDRRLITVLVLAEGPPEVPLAGAVVASLIADPSGRGARLYGGPRPEDRARTGAAGQAGVRTSREGDVLLLVEASRHRPRIVRVPEDATPPFRIVLSRGLSLAGTVRWADGAPAAGATVARGPLGASAAATDAAGRFVLPGLEPGLHRIDVRSVRDGATYAATAFEEAGATDVEVRLPAEPARGPLTLVVTDGAGRPVAGASVAGRSGGRDPLEGGVTDTEGRWEAAGDPGTRWLVVAPPAPPEDQPATLAPIVLTVTPDLTGTVRVGLPAAVEVSGRVVDAQGSPIAGAEVTATPRVPGSRRYTFWQQDATTWTEEDGTFRIEGAAPGDVWIEASADGWEPREFDRWTAPAEGLEIVLARMPPEQEVTGVVRDPEGSASPEASVWWRPVPERVPTGDLGPFWQWRAVDRQGRFRIQERAEEFRIRVGLPLQGAGEAAASEVRWKPGDGPLDLRVPHGIDFTVRVEGLPPGADPSYLFLRTGPRGYTQAGRVVHAPVVGETARFRGLWPEASVIVSVQAGAEGLVGWLPDVAVRTGRATVRLGQPGTIRGRVVLAPGRTAQYVSVSRGLAGTWVIGSDGRFVVPGVPPGEHEVTAVAFDPQDVELARLYGTVQARAGDEDVVVTPDVRGSLFPE